MYLDDGLTSCLSVFRAHSFRYWVQSLFWNSCDWSGILSQSVMIVTDQRLFYKNGSLRSPTRSPTKSNVGLPLNRATASHGTPGISIKLESWKWNNIQRRDFLTASGLKLKQVNKKCCLAGLSLLYVTHCIQHALLQQKVILSTGCMQFFPLYGVCRLFEYTKTYIIFCWFASICGLII